jgi:hypothetical protein
MSKPNKTTRREQAQPKPLKEIKEQEDFCFALTFFFLHVSIRRERSEDVSAHPAMILARTFCL